MVEDKFNIIRVDKNSALPAANQLARQLTWLIAEGAIKEGERLPPIREFSEVLDIHHHTVRAAYHQLAEKNLVSINTRIGTVVKNYVPFLGAREAENPNNQMIAILVPALSDFYQTIISGIESIALECRLIPVVLSCHEDPVYAEYLYKILSSRDFAGILNISLGFTDEFHAGFDQIKNFNHPLVFLDVTDANTHSLTIDTAGAIDLAASHLIGHGYSDLALITCPVDWPVGREAAKGFRQALESAGRDLDETRILTVPDFGYDAGRFIMDRMLHENKVPRAIVTVSDNLALGAMAAAKQRRLRIPEDVAFIGFNDIYPAKIVDPPLSSVSLPLFDMGKRSMLAMNKVLGGGLKNWIHHVFKGELSIRQSCGCTAENKMEEK